MRRPAPLAPAFPLASCRGAADRALDQKWTDREVVERAVQKGADGVSGGPDDRLLVHVERCVDHGRHARATLVLLDDAVVARVVLAPDQLWARGVVHMHHPPAPF